MLFFVQVSFRFFYRKEVCVEGLQKAKKIGVIVDAASFHHMMRIIGIGQASLSKLLEVVSGEVSKAIQAIVTVGFAQYVTAAEDPERFEKRVASAGFQFIPTDPYIKDSDDAEVNRRILLANPIHIDALVVVTTDLLDYVKSLERKRAQNISIFIASITAADTDGGFPLSVHSRHMIKEKNYTLIELEQYRKDLLLTEWSDRSASPAIIPMIKESVRRIGMTIAFSSPGGADDASFAFMTMLTAFMKKNQVRVWKMEMQPNRAVISLELEKGSRPLLSFFMTMANFLGGRGISDFQITGGSSSLTP